MELIKGGSDPMTRDDARALQITMLAGFKLCMEELVVLTDIISKNGAQYSKEEADLAISRQALFFKNQMGIACRQISQWKNLEQDDSE